MKKLPSSGRFVALFDIHWGYVAGEPIHINLKPVFKFIKDYQPKVVMLMGDTFDFTPFSRWLDAGKSLGILRTVDTAKQMYEGGVREVLQPLREAAGDAYILWACGNHDDWVRQAIVRDPNGDGYWDIEENLGGIPDAVIPYPQLCVEPVEFGGVAFTHGFNRLGTRTYHARKMLSIFHRSVFYGHYHEHQVHEEPAMGRGVIRAESVPCLCNTNPWWLVGAAPAWTNGFLVGEVTRRGNFHANVVRITGGEFKFGNTTYR